MLGSRTDGALASAAGSGDLARNADNDDDKIAHHCDDGGRCGSKTRGGTERELGGMGVCGGSQLADADADADAGTIVRRWLCCKTEERRWFQ